MREKRTTGIGGEPCCKSDCGRRSEMEGRRYKRARERKRQRDRQRERGGGKEREESTPSYRWPRRDEVCTWCRLTCLFSWRTRPRCRKVSGHRAKSLERSAPPFPHAVVSRFLTAATSSSSSSSSCSSSLLRSSSSVFVYLSRVGARGDIRDAR